MTIEWHYTTDGQQRGPVTAPQLKQLADNGQLKPSDLVWHEGLESWTPASQLKGLFSGPAQDASPPASRSAPYDSPNVAPQSTPEAPRLQSSTAPSPGDRPLGIVLTAMFSAVVTVMFFLVYFAMYSSSGYLIGHRMSSDFAESIRKITMGIVGAMALAICVLQATTCYGLFTRQKWARLLTLISYGAYAGFTTLVLLGSLRSPHATTIILLLANIAAAGGVIVYFCQPQVKEYLDR